MNTVLKIFLSMSFSGSLLILVLLLGKRLLQDKISRQWQYYIWLIVILRLLLPFGPKASLLGETYVSVEQAVTQAASFPQQGSLLHALLNEIHLPRNGIYYGMPKEHTLADKVLQPLKDMNESTKYAPKSDSIPDSNLADGQENSNSLSRDLAEAPPLQDMKSLLIRHIWLIWLMTALGMLIRKITIYQSFVRYLNAGASPVSHMDILDRLFTAAEEARVKKPVELSVNPLISSPLLIGFFHPCIVLPSADIPEKDFRYIVMHELTHYKRRDMFYQWLVQLTVCLHWFNPLVHLMCREIAKAREFSCDEAVLAKMGHEHAQDYGKTLLDAMAAAGTYREHLGAVTLSENKQLLKERLGAIMNFGKSSKPIRLLSGVLTLCIILGASFIGIYSDAAASGQIQSSPRVLELNEKDMAPSKEETDKNDVVSSKGETNANDVVSSNEETDDVDVASEKGESEKNNELYASQAEQYYEAGSIPLFQIVFSRLDEDVQEEWLDRIYAERNIAFFGAAVNLLDEDCALIRRAAEKAYQDHDAAFFSTLAMHMSKDLLEEWLNKALEDKDWSSQSILFHALDRDDEFEEQEKIWEKAQLEAYEAVGVTMVGKNYYYQGQLVHIFLDIRSNKSFYTLDVNPAGTVDIKIIRNGDNEITGAAYMTEAEAAELFGYESEQEEETPFGNRN